MQLQRRSGSELYLICRVDDDEEQYVLDMSLDNYGARQRAITMNVPEHECEHFMQHVEASERMGRSEGPGIVYPSDLMTLNTERKRVLNEHECSQLPTLSQKMKRQRIDN